MRRKWFYKIPGIILIVIAAVALFGSIVQHLWNWLIPAIVGWHAITFWQAVGLLVLSKILFGGGFRGRGNMRWRSRMGTDGRRCLPKNAKNSAGACADVSVVGNSNRRSKRFEAE